MKTTPYLLFLFLTSLAAGSCEKIDNEPETGGPDPVEDPSLWLWPGEDTLLRMAGDVSAYSVSSDMEEVAVAEITEDGILITAGRYGNTSVHVERGADRRITVSVSSMMISGQWESLTGDETDKSSIVVEAEDAAFAEELSEQLQEETNDLLGYIFQPYVNTSTREQDSATFIKVIRGTPPEPVLRGSYSFGELTLTLNPANGGEEEVYRLLPYQDRMILGLERDLTARYQDRYPDQGIRQVTVTLHLKHLLPPG